MNLLPVEHLQRDARHRKERAVAVQLAVVVRAGHHMVNDSPPFIRAADERRSDGRFLRPAARACVSGHAEAEVRTRLFCEPGDHFPRDLLRDRIDPFQSIL